MNNILYLTNKEIPYKIKYFNEIAKNNNLTVYFDQKNNGDRNQKWSKSIKMILNFIMPIQMILIIVSFLVNLKTMIL